MAPADKDKIDKKAREFALPDDLRTQVEDELVLDEAQSWDAAVAKVVVAV